MKVLFLFAAWALGLSLGSPANEVPESARLREVIERIKPRLAEELERRKLEFGAPIYIRIFKEEKELELWMKSGSRFKLFKTYPIHYFSGKPGPKLKEGDLQAPEGFYYVPPSAMNPASRFHLSFNLGFPNEYDRAHGRTGSALMVHGDTVSIGCFAMTDERIEEIYALADAALRSGQEFFRVHIFPFRMTKENIQKHSGSKWRDFWLNLKEGHEFFERTRRPPNVKVEDGRYVFEPQSE